jgi:hypothetical protein
LRGDNTLNNLDENIKKSLDEILAKYKVQPVGWGYIDCITIMDNVREFIQSLTDLGINIYAISWWCHCANWVIYGDNKETGCPHGGGGPESKYFDGCFSEMYQIPNMEFSNNGDVLHFILNEWQNHKEYLPCLVPAFWLNVPDDWRNLIDA